METAFFISGYWKDAKEPFENYLVLTGTEIPQILKDQGFIDENVFMSEMSEDDIKWHIENQSVSAQDFIIMEYQPAIDWFMHYEHLSDEVNTIIESFDEEKDAYAECERLLTELKPHGYTFEYYLDGVPFNLRRI